MQKSIAALFLAAFPSFAPTQVLAALISPVGLAPGSQYQLVFLTADTIVGSYGTEAPYNSFVTAEAALDLSLPDATWNAVTSTVDGTNANVNAPSGGLPIYNTHGALVATATTGLYTLNLLKSINYDQFGNSNTNNVWTGSRPSGTAWPDRTLGTPNPELGIPALNIFGGWAAGGFEDYTTPLSIYALSSPITLPVPEPASLTLASSAFLVIGAMRFVRWRQKVSGCGQVQ